MDQVIEQRETIEQIVIALRSTEAYLPNHDRVPDIPFIVRFKSGKVIKMAIGYKQTTAVSNGKLAEGVLIDFSPDGGFNKGEGFCEPLLPVLRELGVTFD